VPGSKLGLELCEQPVDALPQSLSGQCASHSAGRRTAGRPGFVL
jgi:hypothetical protein